MLRAVVTTFTLASIALLSGCTTNSASVSEISSNEIPQPIVKSGEKPKYSRIVALANGSAEVIAALGYSTSLVGRDIASNLPELGAIPIDNPAHSISTELVLSQKPDLVIIDANTSPQSAINTLRQSGIKIAKVDSPFSVPAVGEKEKEIAQLIGVPRAGALLSGELSRIAFPKKQIKVLFLYLRGTSSIYLIGGKGSGGDSLLATLGFRDVGAENLLQPFSAMTSEKIISLNPDIFLVMSKGLQSVGGVDGFLKLPGVSQTSAGKNRRILSIDDSLLLSFGPRTIPLLKLMHFELEKILK